jgi:uncharacterized repeat protein (TIGR01451 family)
MKFRPLGTGLYLLALLTGPAVFGQPIITDFSPKVGSPGDVMTLSGTGFTSPGLIVRFWNGVPVINGFINSDLLITVTVPTGATTGPISVQQGAGTPSYTPSDFTVIGLGPYISDFSPLYGSVNDLITINGVHLTNLLAVQFNGTNSTSINVNAAGNQVTARVPFGATNGFISVSTIYGTSNSPTSFTVLGPGPFISDFSPVVGNAGTKVLIDGVHFTGATNATFNGTPGLNFAVQSDTLIRVDTPPGVSSGPLAVNSALGTWVTTSNFFVPPSITGFSPGAGRTGTNVVINGANFAGATNVSFNGLGTTNYLVLSNSTIVATVPTNATTGLIRVIAPAGSSFSSSNFVVQPVVFGFTPNFGPPGTSVTITGANLTNTPVVRFNGVTAAAPTGVTFGQLTAVVPAGATTGPISVTTTDGSYTNASLFYLPASITNFSPTNAAAGSRVTIHGQNLIGASAVSFNGTAAQDFAVTNTTTLGVTVPTGVITGPITLTTPAGSVSSSALFYGAPVITNFTPTHGLPGANVTINGVSFLGATAVSFAGLSASFSVSNNGKISAIVPNGAQSGPITVVAPGGTNTSTASFLLDYTSDLQVSVTASPNPVTIGSNLLYTVTIFNNGPYPAQNVSLTNTLPTTVSLQSVVASAGWTLATNGNTLIGGASNLVNSGNAALLISVIPQTIGNIVDTAAVGSDTPDPSPQNNSFTLTTTVEPLALLSISLLTNQVKVAWPLGLNGYVLQSKDMLVTNNLWSNVTATSIISGSLQFVTESNSGAARFYRLRK